MRSGWGGVAALGAVVVVGAASEGCSPEESPRSDAPLCPEDFRAGAELVEGSWDRWDGADVAAGALVQGAADLTMATASLVAELTTRCSAILRLGGTEVPTPDTRDHGERALAICEAALGELQGALGRQGARLAAPGACLEEPGALAACEALCAEALACASCIGAGDCRLGCRASATARSACPASAVEVEHVEGSDLWCAAAEAHLGAIAAAIGPRREALQVAAADLDDRLADLWASGRFEGRLGVNGASITSAVEEARRDLDELGEVAQQISWLVSP